MWPVVSSLAVNIQMWRDWQKKNGKKGKRAKGQKSVVRDAFVQLTLFHFCFRCKRKARDF
jgi:hypothetical protein